MTSKDLGPLPARSRSAYGSRYRGRFAPSPTGLLHEGSLVAALASWLDARSWGGAWLVRIEDTDRPRCSIGAAEGILSQLETLGLKADEPVAWQSRRTALYQAAIDRLAAQQDLYRCRCSRREILMAVGGVHPTATGGEVPYPGTCRSLDGPFEGLYAMRLRVPERDEVAWVDRRLGPQHQNVSQAVGDFVLKRRDGLWAYQLAVVVDDADQGITDVVRGEDLADNTPRQIVLQRALGVPALRYLHTPLVLAADGRKLSKQNAATPLDLSDPVAALAAAGRRLGLPEHLGAANQGSHRRDDWLQAAVAFWPWSPARGGIDAPRVG